jgi:hypothetical protein
MCSGTVSLSPGSFKPPAAVLEKPEALRFLSQFILFDLGYLPIVPPVFHGIPLLHLI